MQRARVLVLPSLEEAQGVVLLEALACGTSDVASRVDDIAEVVTPDVGVPVPAGDHRSLSEAVVRMLKGEQVCEDISRVARQRAVSCYGWDSVAAKTIALYQAVVGAE